MTGSTSRIYLDHNATAPLRPEARAAILAAMELVGNASSVHAEGRRARAMVEDAREAVAALIGADPAEVVFTAGATEANNWVVRAGWQHLVVSSIEHQSVLAPASTGAASLRELPCGTEGVVRLDVLRTDTEVEAPQEGTRTLLSLQLANSETGVIQPVAEATRLGRGAGFIVHTDAVQAAGRIPVDFASLGVDLMSISAHKIGGPTGVGALVIRDGIDLPALISGGGQERRRRAGTENVAAIAGFGAAAHAALVGLAIMPAVAALRDDMERGLIQLTPAAVVVGANAPRLPNTSTIAMPSDEAATLLIKLDLAGIAVSAGSACSSGKVGGSHVLAAMGLAPELARAAIRISLGPTTTRADIDAFLAAWSAIHDGRTRPFARTTATGPARDALEPATIPGA